MTILNTPWPYLATASSVALIAIYAWKQPHRPGIRYFYWVSGFWVISALVAAFSMTVQTTELRYGLWVLQVVCLQLVVSAELMFSLEFTGNEKWLNRRSLALIFSPALILGLLPVIIPMDRLVLVDTHSSVEIIVANEPVRWGYFAVNSATWIINVGVLGGSLLRAPAFAAPIGLLLLGQIIPRIAFVAFDPEVITVPPGQISLLFSSFTALAYLLVLYNHRLLRVMPVAWSKVISLMPNGMIVLDAENYLVAFNPAAQALPGLPHKLVLRQAASRSLGGWWKRIYPLIRSEPVCQDMPIQTGAEEKHFRVSCWPLLHISGWRMGQVFSFEDITQELKSLALETQTLWANASMQERQIIAHELHDDISQTLAFLNLQASAAQVQIQAGQTMAAQTSLKRLTEAASQIQENTREMIGNLLTASLPMEDFCATLRQIKTNFEQQSGLIFHLDIEGDEAFYSCIDSGRLSPSVGAQLVRMVQEALANVRKHALEASQVIVQLSANDGHLYLTIEDDGVGFNPAAQIDYSKHFGLAVMRQRAEHIGGKVFIDSAPGRGTRVEICIPLINDGAKRLS